MGAAKRGQVANGYCGVRAIMCVITALKWLSRMISWPNHSRDILDFLRSLILLSADTSFHSFLLRGGGSSPFIGICGIFHN